MEYQSVIVIDFLGYVTTLPQLHRLVGAFAKLPKATINFVMSGCPSACKNSVAAGRNFIKFDI